MLNEHIKAQLKKRIEKIDRPYESNIHDWLSDKGCKNHPGEKVVFYKKFNSKIDRYAVACSKCGSFIGWLPNALMQHIHKDDIISENERFELTWRNK